MKKSTMENQDKKIWTKKGATLSDKNARKEYGITQNEIVEGISQGKLQYRVNYIHGNPYYKLVREEVERLISEKYGEVFLQKQTIAFRIKQVNSELRKLKRQAKILTIEKDELELKLIKLEKESN